MADVETFVRGVTVMPQLVAGARVDGPNVVGHGDVQDAVHHERRAFQLARFARLKLQANPKFSTFSGVICAADYGGDRNNRRDS